MMLRTIFLGATAALGIATAVSAAVVPAPLGKTDSVAQELRTDADREIGETRVDIAISRARHVCEVTARRDTTWGGPTGACLEPTTNLAWPQSHRSSSAATLLFV
jgi:hypothetical protein